MWIYEKKLERPICVSCPDIAFAKLVITQYGGPDGELSASLQYINQRYSMPTNKAKAVLTDIGTEVFQKHINAKIISGKCLD